ncbi:ArsR/SmtB family transcription factor [Desulfotomaculum nigrificans]|uniref:ArsR/SmtB family transcription factor n=1 Tax=Desulfotomaculum nigrificans TaxID=1565 RepID=UPI00249F7E58|nr:metalloregulator ArsR/SmtB family transcription factor [Desulfotomaculum nigrificans]
MLADETRLQIIQLLLTHDFCVGALAKNLGLSEAAVSQHIQILRKGGVLKGEKRGYWTHYSVEREVLHQVARALQELANRPTAHEVVCRRGSVIATNLDAGGEETDV